MVAAGAPEAGKRLSPRTLSLCDLVVVFEVVVEVEIKVETVRTFGASSARRGDLDVEVMHGAGHDASAA